MTLNWRTEEDWLNSEKNNIEVVDGSFQLVTALPDSVVDDFEDDNINEYSGDTGSATVQSSVVQEGSQALESTPPDSSHWISSTSGLDSYLSRGDRCRCHIRYAQADGGEVVVGFHRQTEGGTGNSNSNEGGYYLWLRPASNDLILRKVNGSSNIDLAAITVSTSTDTWYDLELEPLSDGTINFGLYETDGTEINSGSVSDSDHSGGGIALGANNNNAGTACYFDFYRIQDST